MHLKQPDAHWLNYFCTAFFLSAGQRSIPSPPCIQHLLVYLDTLKQPCFSRNNSKLTKKKKKKCYIFHYLNRKYTSLVWIVQACHCDGNPTAYGVTLKRLCAYWTAWKNVCHVEEYSIQMTCFWHRKWGISEYVLLFRIEFVWYNFQARFYVYGKSDSRFGTLLFWGKFVCLISFQCVSFDRLWSDGHQKMDQLWLEYNENTTSLHSIG